MAVRLIYYSKMGVGRSGVRKGREEGRLLRNQVTFQGETPEAYTWVQNSSSTSY